MIYLDDFFTLYETSEFILIYLSLIAKQAIFAYVNHAQIRSWYQTGLSNEGKVSCSRKQRDPLMGLELMTDKHSPIMSQTRYQPGHATPYQ